MKSTSSALIVVSALVAVAVAGYPLVSRVLPKATPKQLATADYTPLEVSNVGSSWYWIERAPKAKEKLLRASATGKEVLAEADEVAGYSVEGDTVVWAARNGKTWRVARRSAGRLETVAEGTDRVGRPGISGGKVIWAVIRPGVVSTEAPLPALGPSAEILVSDASAPKSSRLMETQCDVTGVRGESAYVVCRRTGAGARTAIYRYSLGDGSARRVAGDPGAIMAVLLDSGELAWTSKSRDSSLPGSIASIRALGSQDNVVTRADWLPAPGTLYGSKNQLYYIGSITNDFWRITNNDELVRPIEVPSDYWPVAVGQSDLLVLRNSSKDNSVTLFTVPKG